MHDPSSALSFTMAEISESRIQKADPLMGVPIKYPLVVEGPNLGDLLSRSLPVV